MANQSGYIDIHHHIIPESYLKALKESGVDKAGGLKIKYWQPEDSIKMMDRLGIEIGITSISDPVVEPLDVEKRKEVSRNINEFQAQLIKEYPNRFGAFASLPLPDFESAIEEVHYAFDTLKLDGIGLLSNYGEQFLGDKAFEPLMKVLNDYHAVVFIHPSAPPKDVKRPEYLSVDFMEEFTFNTTRAASNLILSGTMDRYPNIKFILSHAGGTIPYLNWRIDKCYDVIRQTMSTNDYVELSKRPKEFIKDFYYDTALSTQPATFEALKFTTDNSHIVFGSDAHYAPEPIGKEMIKTIENYDGYSDETKSKVKRDNALALFPRFEQ